MRYCRYHSPDRETVRSALSAMNGAQAHRGPDDEGVEVLPFGRQFLGLGHRRLAIFDLSPTGHQPMKHQITSSWLLYNGEIYNFRKLLAQSWLHVKAFAVRRQ